MLKKAVFLVSLTFSTALASDLDLGVKLYNDGMYSLAAKTFKEGIDSLSPKDFKRLYKYIYLSFLKSKDYDSLRKFVSLWEEKFPQFHKGELLALKFVLSVEEGVPPEKAFPENELKSLSIDEKINFFKVLSESDLPLNALYYVVLRSSKDVEMKGALRDSGLLSESLKRAVKENNYQLVDLIFDEFGRWFKSPEEEVQYVEYLERKKRYPEALVEAQNLYRKWKSDKARFELAKAYYLNKKYEGVVKLIGEPKTTEEKYLLAWALYRLGKVREIPKVLGLNVSKPKEPKSLKVLEDFYSGKFDLSELRELYPELYAKALIFSFSSEIPKEGLPADLGYVYYERGLYDRAEEELKRAVQNPSDKLSTARTLYLLGKIGTVNRDVGSVVYNQLMGSYQDTPYYRASLVDAAKVYLLSGAPQLSVKLLEYAYKQAGFKGRELFKLLGTSYFNLQNYEKAERFLKKVPDGDTLTLLAFSQYALGKKREAYDTLKEEIKNSSLFPEVNEGRVCYLAEELGKGRELPKLQFLSPVGKTMAALISRNLKYAERIFPTLPQREKIVLSLYLTKMYESRDPKKSIFYATQLFNIAPNEEIASFSKQYMNYLAYKSGNFEPLIFNDPYFIAYNPENAGADVLTLISKARDYEGEGEYGKAYGLLKLSLRMVTSPKLKDEIVKELVEIDLKQKNFERALRDVSLVQNKDLKNYLLFKIYLSQGKLIDAYSAAQSVKNLKNIPEEERGYFIGKLAHYYKLIGKPEKALELSEELLKYLKGANYDDLVNLGILAQEKGKLELAQKLINEAVKKARTKRDKAEALFWRASIEAQRKDLDGALIDYMKIAYELKVEPWSSTSLYRAAQLLEKKGDYRQALKLYEKVAQIKRGTKEGEIARERVKSLLKRVKEEE